MSTIRLAVYSGKIIVLDLLATRFSAQFVARMLVLTVNRTLRGDFRHAFKSMAEAQRLLGEKIHLQTATSFLLVLVARKAVLCRSPPTVRSIMTAPMQRSTKWATDSARMPRLSIAPLLWKKNVHASTGATSSSTKRRMERRRARSPRRRLRVAADDPR